MDLFERTMFWSSVYDFLIARVAASAEHDQRYEFVRHHLTYSPADFGGAPVEFLLQGCPFVGAKFKWADDHFYFAYNIEYGSEWQETRRKYVNKELVAYYEQYQRLGSAAHLPKENDND